MIEEPGKYAEVFQQIGADILSVHMKHARTCIGICNKSVL